MSNILYLGSQSQSRHRLLTEAEIPFKVLGHSSDEIHDENPDFAAHVLAVAKGKMQTLILPESGDKPIFVLTADTLIRTQTTKEVMGKPKDLTDALRMLRAIAQGPVEVVTGVCLEKKVRKSDGQAGSSPVWKTIDQLHWTSSALIEFIVPEEDLDSFFEKLPSALVACGAAIVEGLGHSFLKSINGSYTAVIGLPVFELRQALKKLGFII